MRHFTLNMYIPVRHTNKRPVENTIDMAMTRLVGMGWFHGTTNHAEEKGKVCRLVSLDENKRIEKMADTSLWSFHCSISADISVADKMILTYWGEREKLKICRPEWCQYICVSAYIWHRDSAANFILFCRPVKWALFSLP